MLSKPLPQPALFEIIPVARVMSCNDNVFAVVRGFLPNDFPLELVVTGVTRQYVTVYYKLLDMSGYVHILTDNWMCNFNISAKHLMQMIKHNILEEETVLTKTLYGPEFMTYVICATLRKVQRPEVTIVALGENIHITYAGKKIGVYKKRAPFKKVLADITVLNRVINLNPDDPMTIISMPLNKFKRAAINNSIHELYTPCLLNLPEWLYESITTIGGLANMIMEFPNEGKEIKFIAIESGRYRLVIDHLESLRNLEPGALSAHNYAVSHPLTDKNTTAMREVTLLLSVLSTAQMADCSNKHYVVFIKESYTTGSISDKTGLDLGVAIL